MQARRLISTMPYTRFDNSSWNWLPPGKRNKWTYDFLDVVPTRKEKRYAYGIRSWAAWILLGADGLFPKRIYNSVQIVWALQIAIDELRGIGCGERNMARWSELDNVVASRDYMDGAGLQAIWITWPIPRCGYIQRPTWRELNPVRLTYAAPL